MITDDRLKEFVLFFTEHYKEKQTNYTGFAISMAGHFHIGTPQTKILIKRCEQLGFIKVKGQVVTINKFFK